MRARKAHALPINAALLVMAPNAAGELTPAANARVAGLLGEPDAASAMEHYLFHMGERNTPLAPRCRTVALRGH